MIALLEKLGIVWNVVRISPRVLTRATGGVEKSDVGSRNGVAATDWTPPPRPVQPSYPSYPIMLDAALGSLPTGFVPTVSGLGGGRASDRRADDLLAAHVVRAVELDINPQWVAGYLYGHRGGVGPLAPVPVARGQIGVSGFFLAPYSRDFFTIVAK